MRIVLASDFALPRRGGIEVQVQGLARALQGAGHVVRVMTPWPGPDEVDGVTFDRVPARFFGLPVAVRTANLADRLADADVVHAHASRFTPFAWRAAGGTACSVLTLHSVPGWEARWVPRSRATCLTAVSPAVVRRLPPGAPVSVLPNGLDVAAWATPRRPHQGLHVVSTLRLTHRKRPLALVPVWAALRQLRPGLRVTVAGDGPLRPRLARALRRAGLGDVVRLVGWLTPAALRALYATADVFLHPTLHEAFGLAVAEAMAAGLPVVVRRGGGPAELVHHGRTGFVADTDASLADGVLAVDPRWGTAARDAAQDYDWSVGVPQVVQCLEKARSISRS